MCISLPMSSSASCHPQLSCIASEAALSWQIDKHLCQNSAEELVFLSVRDSIWERAIRLCLSEHC